MKFKPDGPYEDRHCFESGRVDSFDTQWPHPENSQCSRVNMAKAGFFYTGVSDCVQCFVCHIKLNDWDPKHDEPWAKHKECASNCLFAILAKDESNLTVEQWCDIISERIINIIDKKFNKVIRNDATF